MLIGNGAGYSQLDKLTATFGADIDNFCDIDPVPAQHLDAAKLAPGLGELIKIMVDRYKAKTGANDVPPHVSMGFNQTWILLQSVLPVAIQKYGGTDAEPSARRRSMSTFRWAGPFRDTASNSSRRGLSSPARTNARPRSSCNM